MEKDISGPRSSYLEAEENKPTTHYVEWRAALSTLRFQHRLFATCLLAFNYVCESAAVVYIHDGESERTFFGASIFYSCHRSHLEITSLMAIDPLHHRELDSINVVPTQTF